MSWYVPRAVAPDLADRLVCAWTAEIQGTHRLVPDGCVDLMWLDKARGEGRTESGQVILCGPETGAWTFTLPSGTTSVGIRFRPGQVADLFRTSLAEIRNQRVGLADLIGDKPARTVSARLADAASHNTNCQDRRVAVLESVARDLRNRCDTDDALPGLIGGALARRTWRISELADAAAMTERQLERRSNRHFGYGPSTLRSILRLQRFMRLARNRPYAGLAELASEAGYADQAHLSRECRAIAGQTPTELLAGQAPDWHGGLPLFLGTPRDPFAPVTRSRRTP